MLYLQTHSCTRVGYHKYGEGPAVVLLHGFPLDGTIWGSPYRALSSYTTIIPDFPGTGKSAPMITDVSMESLADVIYDMLQHETITSAVIAGHSMGGYVALAFAEKYGQMLKGIAMVHSTAKPDDEARKELRKKVVDLIRKGGREAFIKQMVPNLFSDVFLAAHSNLVQQQVEKSLEISDEAIIDFYNAMMVRGNKEQVLTNAAFPVAWMLGKDDKIVLLDNAIKQARIASVNFVNLYSDCGHMSMIEHSDHFAKDLIEFITYCYR